MAPRKRPRKTDSEGSAPIAPGTPLKPSRATTTSQVSSLSAAPASSTPTSTTPSILPRQDSDSKGMAPPSLPKSGSSNKQDGGNSSEGSGSKVIHKTKSWYGSLTRKSTASTSIQRETIVGSPLKAGSTPDFHRYDLKRTGDNASLSGASQASVNAPSKLHETALGDTQSSSAESDTTRTGIVTNPTKDPVNSTTPTTDDVSADTPMPDAPPPADVPERPTTSSGWLGGWFYRSPETPEKPSQVKTDAASEPPKEAESEIPMEQTVAREQNPSAENAGQRAASWFSLSWVPYATTSSDGPEQHLTAPEPAPTAPKDVNDAPLQDATPQAPEPVSKPSAGSTWAFWSRDTPKSPGNKADPPETGELAVMGERSERHPKRANSMDMSQGVSAKSVALKEPPLKINTSKDKGKRSKRNRPQSMDLDDVPSRPQTPQSDTVSIKADSPSKNKTKTPTTATKTSAPNLLLPSFRGTYRMKDNPSIMKQIAALLLRTQQPAPKHVFLAKDPPKIKKAVAIGVHGLFPASFLRPMIGQPTGTSVKFAQHAADAIRRWAHNHGCADDDVVIEKAALEGEGKIEHRVANLWSLLQNWMDHIRGADLVLIACHSQGVPVSVMLLEKLIESGAVNRAKVGVCAMAGVNLGPFAEYKGGMGMFMGSAAELWEFANSESEVSKRYEAALKRVLSHGVRITYVGSIDDQLVPIESAIYSPATHPYLYRAIFIDGRLHAPDFIAHLVGFACKLRNLGISDHGLIRELSVPLAGSLYGGEGHSRLYDDEQVYDLAISHALETTNVGSVSCEIKRHDGLTTPNPYYLPWIMRGLLEEDLVKTELSAEADELLRKFDEWKPTTKALKDVKFRLEAVRSRL
ncbi:hypothetical protein N0V93_005399 [Gnomoniopsis smithogilvyi]|uniref:YMC020W-like alpha/beta hydrolase domain-containing protein n=1 Tax=Gnomoniopsis smithogilvyi TaxID=1191159 RepID=A0A9W8YT89_9PEZI|nr:hypothetical protein N0V93_005399 [Gnomoniopsis smithogilvyi]